MPGSMLRRRYAHILQDPKPFSHGIAADSELFGEFSLPGKSAARFQISAEHFAHHMIDHDLIRFLFFIFLIVLHTGALNKHTDTMYLLQRPAAPLKKHSNPSRQIVH